MLWKARNTLVFENRTITPEDSATKAISLAREWIYVQDCAKVKKDLPNRGAQTVSTEQRTHPEDTTVT